VLNFILLQLQQPHQSVQWLAMIGMTGCVAVPFNTVSKMVLLCFFQSVATGLHWWHLFGLCFVISYPLHDGLSCHPSANETRSFSTTSSVHLLPEFIIKSVLSYFYLPLTLMLYFSNLY